MCDQTPVDYHPGDVVWVKLSSIWWPGEVQDQTQLDEEVTSGLRKEPLAVVKFFDEDSYEFPKNLDQIYRYNCLRKDEFIKKGLDLFRAAAAKTTFRSIPSSIEKFPRDVVTAETLVKGDPQYIHHPKFAMGAIILIDAKEESPAKMIKLDDDDDDNDSDIMQNFGSPSPKVTFNMPLKGKGSTPRNKSIKKSLNTTVTPPSILKKKRPDHSLYDLADPKYFCIMCKTFVSRHRSVVFSHFALHYRGVLQPRPPVIPAKYEEEFRSTFPVAPADPPKSQERRKRKKPPEDPTPKKSEVVNNDSEASTSTSHKKRNKKVKITHEPEKPKPPIALELLEDWQDSDDEESTAINTKHSEDKPLPAESINSTKPDEVSTSPAKSMTSCFDFEDNEDSLNVDGVLKFGQKLPRVLNEKLSSNRMRTNSRTEDISEDFSKQVDSFLETTDIPDLPLIPPSLSTDASGHMKISVTSEKKNSITSPTLSEVGVNKNTDKKKSHFTYHSSRKSTSEENESIKKKKFDVVSHNYSRSQSTNQNHPSNSELSCEDRSLQSEEEPEENKVRRKSLRSAPKTIEVDILTENVEIDILSKENIPDINESLSKTSEKPVSGLMLPTLEAGDAEFFPTPQQTSKEKDIQINEKYKNITENSEINSDFNNLSSLKSDEESTTVDKEINNSPGHFLCIDDVKTKPPEIPQHHMILENDKSLKEKSDFKPRRVSNSETNEREKHDRKVKDKYSQESDKKKSKDKQRIAKAKTEISGKHGKERERSSRRYENEQKLSKHSSERLTRIESRQEKNKSTHRSSNNDTVKNETERSSRNEPCKSIMSETSNPTKKERKSILSETSNPTKNEPRRSTTKETDRPESGGSRKNETNRSARSRSESDRSTRNELETSTRSRSDKRTKNETERSKKHSTERPGRQDSGKHESERTPKHSVEKTTHHDVDKTKRHEKKTSRRRRSETEEICERHSKNAIRRSFVKQGKETTNHKEKKLSNQEDESSRNKLEKKDKSQHLNDARDKTVKHEKNANISSEKSNYKTSKQDKRSKSKIENREFKKQKVSHGENVSLPKINNDNENTLNKKLLLSLDHNNSSHEVSNLKYNENDSIALEIVETCSSEQVVNKNLHATEENSTINETEIRFIEEPTTVYNKVTFAEVISLSEQNACSGIATKQDDNHEINLSLKSLSEISMVQGTPDKTKNLLKDDTILPEQQTVASNERTLKTPDTSYQSSSFEESPTASLEPSPNLSETSKHLPVSPKQCSLLETLSEQTPRPSETLEQQFCLISPPKSSILQTSFEENSNLSEIRNEPIGGQITPSEVISLSQASSSPTTPIKSVHLEAFCELGPSPSVHHPVPNIPSKQYLSPEAFLEEMQSQSESSEPPILVTPSNQHAIPDASPRKSSILAGISDQFPSSTSTLKETLETCQEQTSSLECSNFLSREPETLNSVSKQTSYEENTSSEQTSSLSEPVEHLPCISTPSKQDIEHDSSIFFGTPKSLPIEKESLELSPSLSTRLKEAVCISNLVDSSVSSVELKTNVSPPGISSITPPQLNKSLEISEKVENNVELSNIEVLPSQSDGLFSAQDMDLDIKNMPIEIESDIEANQLPLMEICVSDKPFNSIPGVKVFHVILRRNREPFPKQFDSVEKHFLKFDKKSEDDNDDSGFKKKVFPRYKPEHDLIFKELNELSLKKPAPVSNPPNETPKPAPVSNLPKDTPTPGPASNLPKDTPTPGHASNLPKDTPTSKALKESSVHNPSVSSDKLGSVSTVITSSVATSGFGSLPVISFPNKSNIGQGTIVLDIPGNASKINNAISSSLCTKKNPQIPNNFKVVKATKTVITGKPSRQFIIATNPKNVRIPTSIFQQQTQQKSQTVGFCPKIVRTLPFTEKTPTLVKSKSRNVLFNGNKMQIAPQPASNSRKHSTEMEKEKAVETTYESKSIHRSPNILQKKSKRPINPVSSSKVTNSNSQIVESVPGVSTQPVLQPTGVKSIIYLTVDEEGNYHPSNPIQQTIKEGTGTILSNPSSKIPRLVSSKKIMKPAGQDILAEALANTQVLQSDIEGAEFINAEFSQTSLSNTVLETSLTLNQPPIMSPLEVPSVMSSLTSKTQTIFITDNSTFQLNPIVVSPAGTSSVEPKYIISGIEPSKSVGSRLDKDNVITEFLKCDITKKTNKSRKSFGDR